MQVCSAHGADVCRVTVHVVDVIGLVGTDVCMYTCMPDYVSPIKCLALPMYVCTEQRVLGTCREAQGPEEGHESSRFAMMMMKTQFAVW
jgi:hypothetical protein